MKTYTDYPFTFLGDTEHKKAPMREIEFISYDGDKYCQIIVDGIKTEIKLGYIYYTPKRKWGIDPNKIKGATNEKTKSNKNH
jgi:hypothetical protein